MHIAGAALAGTPGVTLGHNEHLAWGVTAGETAAMLVLRERARASDEFFEERALAAPRTTGTSASACVSARRRGRSAARRRAAS